jgi:hypothetical protein
MKISTLVLSVSLAANLALVAVFVAGTTDNPASASGPRNVQSAAPAPAAADTAPASADVWAELRSDDLHTEIDRLRREGFPPATMRAIIAAQVRAGFAARRKALEAAQGDLPFWKNATPDPNTQAALRALGKEEQKVIKDLLGPDAENSYAASLRRQFPNVSGDKIDQLSAIRERYDDQRMALYAAASGGMTMLPDERAKIDALDKAMHGEFAGVLSPQELEDYDLRTSNTANQLRYNLSAFDPTEQEFRTLYKLQSAFDEQWAPYRGMGMQSEDQMRARGEAQRQLTDQIKAALGGARYAEYQRATDYNYRQTTQLVARLELPPEAAIQVYAVQQDIQDRMRNYQAMPPNDERLSQFSALATEAQTRITAVIGPKGYEAYKQYGGSWLQNLAPRPPRPPAPK